MLELGDRNYFWGSMILHGNKFHNIKRDDGDVPTRSLLQHPPVLGSFHLPSRSSAHLVLSHSELGEAELLRTASNSRSLAFDRGWPWGYRRWAWGQCTESPAASICVLSRWPRPLTGDLSSARQPFPLSHLSWHFLAPSPLSSPGGGTGHCPLLTCPLMPTTLLYVGK